MAFVKAPITCLDNFSLFNANLTASSESSDKDSNAMKHVVIRVEVLSNPPSKYGLFHSYNKEFVFIYAFYIYI